MLCGSVKCGLQISKWLKKVYAFLIFQLTCTLYCTAVVHVISAVDLDVSCTRCNIRGHIRLQYV